MFYQRQWAVHSGFLLIATADTVGKYEGHYLLILITKNEKVFYDIFKQLVQKENKEQAVKLTDAEDHVKMD